MEDGNKVERIYGLAPASKSLLGHEDEGSMASLLALNSHRAPSETWHAETFLSWDFLFFKLNNV
jgi:hypothetical protein